MQLAKNMLHMLLRKYLKNTWEDNLIDMQYIINIKTFIIKLRPFNSRDVPPVFLCLFTGGFMSWGVCFVWFVEETLDGFLCCVARHCARFHQSAASRNNCKEIKSKWKPVTAKSWTLSLKKNFLIISKVKLTFLLLLSFSTVSVLFSFRSNASSSSGNKHNKTHCMIKSLLTHLDPSSSTQATKGGKMKYLWEWHRFSPRPAQHLL